MLQGPVALRPAKHRQPMVKGMVYARVQKVHTVPVPAGPVYKTPRCYLYPCGTLSGIQEPVCKGTTLLPPPDTARSSSTRATLPTWLAAEYQSIRERVTTMTVPTPIRPIPTCLRPSRVIWITPKHPMPNPNPLTPSRFSNALPNIPTPLHLVNAFPTQCTFNLSSPSRQVDSRHPHSFPTRCSFDLSSSSHQVDSRQPHSFPTRHLSTFTPLCQVYSQRFISLATAVGRSPIAYLPRSMRLSPSFLAPYIYVPLHSSVTSLATLCSFSMSHPQFPVSIYPCFIYLYSLPPLPLL